jgi:hypothetical protein
MVLIITVFFGTCVIVIYQGCPSSALISHCFQTKVYLTRDTMVNQFAGSVAIALVFVDATQAIYRANNLVGHWPFPLIMISEKRFLQYLKGKLPALGYNTYNAYKCNNNEADLLSAANSIVSLGLKTLGYTYVNSMFHQLITISCEDAHIVANTYLLSLS